MEAKEVSKTFQDKNDNYLLPITQKSDGWPMARNGQWFPNPKNVSILSHTFDESGGHEIVL